MPREPEAAAKAEIDRLLTAAGWAVQDSKHAGIHAARGVAFARLAADIDTFRGHVDCQHAQSKI